MINPFAWVTLIFGISGITWFGKYSFLPFKEQNGVVTTSKMFPEDESPSNILADGTLKYDTNEEYKPPVETSGLLNVAGSVTAETPAFTTFRVHSKLSLHPFSKIECPETLPTIQR